MNPRFRKDPGVLCFCNRLVKHRADGRYLRWSLITILAHKENKMKLLIKELNPNLWGDLERLFGATVLPEVSLSVLSSAIVHLYAYRRFIRLDIVTLQKFPPHAATIGVSSSPTRITQPSRVARDSSIPVSRSRIALWR
jgi:cytochrome c oxidase subunit IV